MTDTPVDSIYSGVVSIPGIRLVTFIAELNELELWATDIGNAHLESVTKEKVAFVVHYTAPVQVLLLRDSALAGPTHYGLTQSRNSLS